VLLIVSPEHLLAFFASERIIRRLALSQKQPVIGLKEPELETEGTGGADEDLHFQRNQLTPNMKATLFMPRLGSWSPAQEKWTYLTSLVRARL
jgi:hypothetical protein